MDGRVEEEAKTTLGLLDTTYLVSYAFFMFIRSCRCLLPLPHIMLAVVSCRCRTSCLTFSFLAVAVSCPKRDS